MREALAERLLATVMNWTPEDVANERPLLQAMAALKYDEYQQFAPGIRFVESLASWLRQFKTDEERRTAFDFVKSRIVFFSAAEIAHLVTIAYPDHIRPLLISRAAQTIGVSECFVGKIANSKEFLSLRRKCLFLGLSDSARIDIFRRSTNTELSHEQIWQTYEMSPEKGKDMLINLKKDLEPLIGTDSDKDIRFEMVFLLDDFYGSGRSCLRKDDIENKMKGKIAKFLQQVESQKELNDLFKKEFYIGIVLYIATKRAVDHINTLLPELLKPFPNISCEVLVVNILDDTVSLNKTRDKNFLDIANSYYDLNVESDHTRIGGTDLKLGFGGCALPIVLNHNTPNNSMFLLWANPDELEVHGLFPRVNRHRSEP